MKRLEKRGERLMLVPANPDYSSIDVTDGEGFDIWGVVTYVIHNL